ncbi:radical SAM family heme chaperone HemW [Celeribacter sp.]|uniref:radical SAM family heme chaperone HemW n=1 Tax=Celeribacter sp. TaxID=1890673 RepID=UPI003A920D87
MEDWELGGFGVYFHWPFCQSKCPYCDFNSHVSASIDQSQWQTAYLSEIDRIASLTQGRVVRSIYFGGGTPSLMDPELVGAILDRVRKNWSLSNDVEITLEANPSSVEADRFEGYYSAGVNRVSLGVQALNGEDLRRLGRLHSVDEARRAIAIAQDVFPRSTFDLIYARQDQTLSQWETELREALKMAAGHISLYQLTVEQGTAFGDRYNAGKLRGLPDEDLSADMYELTQAICEAEGLPAYEISNHAEPDMESRHNLIYWNYGDYAGIGPGAHGRLTLDGIKHATDTPLLPAAWLDRVAKSGNGDLTSTALPLDDQTNEYLMMGLRTTQGIDLRRIPDHHQTLLLNKINELRDFCLIMRSETHLQVTPKGRPLLNAILRDLLVD